MTRNSIILADRALHVEQTLANHAIEGFAPDVADKLLFARYVAGTASVNDLLSQARLFALEAKKGGVS
jgi:hypothetical protein